jgi:DNA-directed RNA polymerase specialized sigma24 family protein
MLYAQPQFQALLRNMVFATVRDPSLHDELVHQLIIHAWQTEAARPAQTPSWYRHNCYMHLLDLLGEGRSLDALKRRRWTLALPDELSEPEPRTITPLPQSREDPLSSASANDAVAALRSKLGSRERAVLELVVQEFTVAEIADHLQLSHATVCGTTARIRKAATRLGLRK